MNAVLKVIVTVLLGVALSACQGGGPAGPSEPDLPEQSKNRILVNGDPLEIVRDTDKNQDSIFTESNILNEYANFSLSYGTLFVNKTKYKVEEEKKSSEELVRERKASEQSLVDETEDYRWRQLDGDVYEFLPAKSTKSNHPVLPYLRFKYFFKKQSDGRLKLVGLNVDGQSDLFMDAYPVEALHYSRHESGDAFSLLFYLNQDSDQILFSMVFKRKPVVAERFSINEKLSPFTLIFGPKLDIHWRQDVPLKVATCGIDNPDARAGIEDGLEVWRKELDGLLSIQHEFKSRCAPFSDLNTHTMRTATYKMMNTGAFTMDVAGSPAQGILDGDVVFLIDLSSGSLTKNSLDPKKVKSGMKLYTAHEFGHLLGLAHQYETDSIMNYTWDYMKKSDKYLTDYDSRAIKTLYQRPVSNAVARGER